MESPEPYHWWCASAALGHLMGRDSVMLIQDFATVYPAQMMIVLVSESAITRKTTAMNRATYFLGLKSVCKRTLIVPAGVTPESMYSVLGLNDDGTERNPGVGLICAPEMGTFFSKAKYMQEMGTLITDLNDCSQAVRIRKTMTHGEQRIIHGCVGMIACTTPTGMAHEIPEYVRTAGFLGRLHMVYCNKPRKANAGIDEVPPAQKVLLHWLETDIMRIAAIKGRFTFTDDARSWYKAWYDRHFAQCDDPNIYMEKNTGWWGRKHTHLLRCAMIYSAARESSLVIALGDVTLALERLNSIEERFADAMKEVDAKTGAGMAARAMRLLLEHTKSSVDDGWVSYSGFMRSGNFTAREMADLVATLVGRERIVIGYGGKRGGKQLKVLLTPGETAEYMRSGVIPVLEGDE